MQWQLYLNNLRNTPIYPLAGQRAKGGKLSYYVNFTYSETYIF